jgi:hypothetical protein
MRKMNVIFLALVIIVFGTVTAWSAPKVTKVNNNFYLNAADVVKVSGLTGAKLIKKDPSKGAGGDLNFATSDDKLIVMVQVVNQRDYAGYKKYDVKVTPIKGLGDEAMQGATSAYSPLNQVVFTKGTFCIALTVFVDPKNPSKNMLTIEQTIELAKIFASRMGNNFSWDWGN